MRTAPPVLPDDDGSTPGYQPGWLERAGTEGLLGLAAAGWGIKVAAIVFATLLLLSFLGGIPSLFAVLMFALVGAVVGAMVGFMASRLAEGAGVVAKSFIQPSGNSTPYEQTFSFQEAMIMRGEIDAAMESYEAIIAEQPANIAARRRAAEHYSKKNRNVQRAAELFREIRDLPATPVSDVLYASSRLVDLYNGPLDDPGKAVVELRRIIERFPGSDLAKHARTALPALKARLAE